MIRPIKLPRWEELNAYVEGALAPARRLEVERAAAAEPGVAAEIERLRALKAALAATLDGVEAPPARLPSRPRPAALPRWVAAAAVLLLAVVSAAVLLLPGAGPTKGSSWLQQAEAAHRDWQAATPTADGLTLPAALSGEAAAYDLTLAGLQLVAVEARPEGHYLGYLGSNGCRLGLWIAPAPPDLTPSLVRHDRGDLLLATWSSGGRGFALLAEDMDPRRFESVAALLLRRTQAGEPQVAGRDSDLTLPCLS